jgi:putative ABC transport system substrate-binding protein
LDDRRSSLVGDARRASVRCHRPAPPNHADASRRRSHCGRLNHRLMNRRAFVTGLGAVLAAPLRAEAQEAGKVQTVGLVSLGGDPLWWQPLLDAVRELGYIEGQNLAVKRAFAKGHAEELRRLVTEITRSGIDVAVTTATRETRAVQQAAPTTPIVMLLVPDPVAEGFVKTLAVKSHEIV